MTLAFFITSLAIIATPGTGAILTISAGLRSGRGHAIVTAAGCTLGTIPHLAVAVAGTSAFLGVGGAAFDALKFAGALYLLGMAWVTWRDNGLLVLSDDAPASSDIRILANAVLVNLLNPKLTLFFVAFLPQFVIAGAGEIEQVLTLSVAFMIMTFLVFSVYGWFAAIMREKVVRRPRAVRRIQRCFSLSYVALALKMMTVAP